MFSQYFQEMARYAWQQRDNSQGALSNLSKFTMNSNFTGIDSKIGGIRPLVRNESVMSESTSLKKRNQELFFNKINKRNASKNQNDDEARNSSLFEDALQKLPVDTYGQKVRNQKSK